MYFRADKINDAWNSKVENKTHAPIAIQEAIDQSLTAAEQAQEAPFLFDLPNHSAYIIYRIKWKTGPFESWWFRVAPLNSSARTNVNNAQTILNNAQAALIMSSNILAGRKGNNPKLWVNLMSTNPAAYRFYRLDTGPQPTAGTIYIPPQLVKSGDILVAPEGEYLVYRVSPADMPFIPEHFFVKRCSPEERDLHWVRLEPTYKFFKPNANELNGCG
jgi:hypothetical protein